MEVAVLKAIKSREDTLDRLKVAAEKLDVGYGGGAPVVLSEIDPLVRLFYRCGQGVGRCEQCGTEGAHPWCCLRSTPWSGSVTGVCA